MVDLGREHLLQQLIQDPYSPSHLDQILENGIKSELLENNAQNMKSGFVRVKSDHYRCEEVHSLRISDFWVLPQKRDEDLLEVCDRLGCFEVLPFRKSAVEVFLDLVDVDVLLLCLGDGLGELLLGEKD